MGVKCCRRSKFSGQYSDDNDIKLKESQNYISVLDNHIDNFENTYNLLRYIDLYHFTDYLFKLQEEYTQSEGNCTKSKLLLMVDDIKFNDFIEKKILNNPIIILAAEPDENLKEQNENFLSQVYFELQKANQTYKDLMKENVIVNSITKINLFTIGFTLCDGTNISKIDELFNMFSQKEKVKESKEFKEFIFLLLSMNSRVYYNSLKNFYIEDEKFKCDDLNSLENSYNENNILELNNFFFKEVFKNKIELNKDDFEDAMSNNVWIFYGNYIRWKLEQFKKI